MLVTEIYEQEAHKEGVTFCIALWALNSISIRADNGVQSA